MNSTIFNQQTETDVQVNPFLSSITDEKLLQLCQQFGEQTRTWRQKFAGLLPEVNKRRLYKKKGFHSIFEFAAKLAGVSEDQVRLVLNLERKFEDKPVLQSLLLNGEVSANKLVRVAAIATAENQEVLAEKVRILPKSALETWVQDEKMINNFGFSRKDFGATRMETASVDEQPTLLAKLAIPAEPLYESLPGQRKTSQLFDDVKLLQKFSEELKEKLQVLDKKGIDINQLLLELLKKREEGIETQKQQIAEEMITKSVRESRKKVDIEYAQSHKANELAVTKRTLMKERKSLKQTRYIPIKIKRIITLEHGTKCSIPTCTKPSQAIHHTQRFSLISHTVPPLTHNPHYLAPLCKEHHIIAHSIDLKFLEKRWGG